MANFHDYAIYHAALALMSKEGYTSKNHSATLCFLIYHHYHLQNALAKEDVELIASSLEKEDIETLGTSKELREKACYNIHDIIINLIHYLGLRLSIHLYLIGF